MDTHYIVIKKWVSTFFDTFFEWTHLCRLPHCFDLGYQFICKGRVSATHGCPIPAPLAKKTKLLFVPLDPELYTLL